MRKSIAVLILLAALRADLLQAGLVTYIGADGGAGPGALRPHSDSAAASFAAAAASLGLTSLITFESAPLGFFSNGLVVAPGVTLGGFQSIVNQSVFPEDLYGYNTTPGGSRFVHVNGDHLTFTFSPAVQSFGAYISGLQTALIGVEHLRFFDGSNQSIPLPFLNGGIAFVGFTDAGEQIATVTIDTSTPGHGDIIGVDDVRFGTIPEPSSIVLFGSALVLLGGMQLLRRRAHPR